MGVDLAKNVIQVYPVGKVGQATIDRHFSRAKTIKFFEQLKLCVIGTGFV